MEVSNVYDDDGLARAYATLDFPGSYFLAFRDLPEIIAEHVSGRSALDFGCGAGRSTRFLTRLGFDSIGIDISPSMIELARAADPAGRYTLVHGEDYSGFEPGSFDLVFSAFAFDNIAGVERRARILRGLRRLLCAGGRVVLLVCAPEIYVNEWASFSTSDFPQNRRARSGERVLGVITDVDDPRPVVDVLWFHTDYLDLFAASELELFAQHAPLGRAGEPAEWVSEQSIAPFAIYVLSKPS